MSEIEHRQRRARALQYAINMPGVANVKRLIDITHAIDGLMADWDGVLVPASIDLQQQVLNGAFALLIRNESEVFGDSCLERFVSDARELMAALVAPSASKSPAGGL